MHYSAKFILSSALYQKGFVKSFIGVSIWTFKKYILGSYELGNPITAPDIYLALRLLTRAAAIKNFVAYDSA